MERRAMGFDQYHEPPEELPQKTRTFARMIASLIEEAEAIGWYEQRMAVETDPEARAVMANAQKEEFKPFAGLEGAGPVIISNGDGQVQLHRLNPFCMIGSRRRPALPHSGLSGP